MAGLPARYYRNYTSDDTVYDDNHGKAGEASVGIETLGWDAPTGYTFKEWNTKKDGTGIGWPPGDPASEVQYAIWEEISSIKYLTTDQSLTAVANAIRTKGGTSAQLVYPEGFVSAIDAIQTATELPSANGKSFGTAQLIMFQIENTFIGSMEQYQAESGMTFREWINSSYNTAGFILYYNEITWEATIVCKPCGYMEDFDGDACLCVEKEDIELGGDRPVSPDDVIDSAVHYMGSLQAM